jgi:hypothetical protein
MAVSSRSIKFQTAPKIKVLRVFLHCMSLLDVLGYSTYCEGANEGADFMGYLSASFVRSAKKPGRYSDGDGLYLLVGPTGSRSWVCRVQRRGKRRDFGLGSETLISLA